MGRPSDEMWRQVNKVVAESGALEKVARKIAAEATQISRANGGKANYSLRPGVRSNGRVYVDVVSDRLEEERGSETVRRINALRRASRGY